MVSDPDLAVGIDKLIKQDWKLLYEDTHPDMPHLGLVAPTPVFSIYS